MKGISLFSGMGGDTLGMSSAGVTVGLHSELIPLYCETHQLNFPLSQLIGNDISTITDEQWASYQGQYDIIFAGFPCQSHSNAGKKKSDDPRGQLYLEFVRATRGVKPKYIVGENVKGLLNRKTTDGELFINKIRVAFEELGYYISYKVLNCTHYGIPQNRERLIIIGALDRVPTFPVPQQGTWDLGLKFIIKFNMEGAIKVPTKVFDMTTLPLNVSLRLRLKANQKGFPTLILR